MEVRQASKRAGRNNIWAPDLAPCVEASKASEPSNSLNAKAPRMLFETARAKDPASQQKQQKCMGDMVYQNGMKCIKRSGKGPCITTTKNKSVWGIWVEPVAYEKKLRRKALGHNQWEMWVKKDKHRKQRKGCVVHPYCTYLRGDEGGPFHFQLLVAHRHVRLVGQTLRRQAGSAKDDLSGGSGGSGVGGGGSIGCAGRGGRSVGSHNNVERGRPRPLPTQVLRTRAWVNHGNG